jgi:hypothetical protein
VSPAENNKQAFGILDFNIYRAYGRQGYEILNGVIANFNPKLISKYFLRE